MSLHTPKEWAHLGVYGALKDYAGNPKKEQETAKRIMFVLQRYNDDLHGELSTAFDLNKIKRLLQTEQGADYMDMGEWAQAFLEAFIKE